MKNAHNLQNKHINSNTHGPFGFYLGVSCSCAAAGNLFYLNGTSLCPSLDEAQRRRSQQNYHGGKWRSVRSDDNTLAHVFLLLFFLQFSDYRDTETCTPTGICKEPHAETKRQTEPVCERHQGHPFDSELWDELTAGASHRSPTE